MDLTQGNLAALYTGLKGLFLESVKEAKLPERVMEFVVETPSDSAEEEYPTTALLGDLEELLDQYTELNLGTFIQGVHNRFFGRIVNIPRADIEDEKIGKYRVTLGRLGRLAARHPYRRVPRLFRDGFATAWIDGAMVFSDTHLWPGGRAWDNLDQVPLTHLGFRLVRQHLRERVGPDGQQMELSPTHLIVGAVYEARAKEIVSADRLAGGQWNADYDPDLKVVVWSTLTGAHAYDWFLVDASEERPVVVQNREAPALTPNDAPTADARFRSERIEVKASRRYGIAIVLPWLIQAVQQGADEATTTTAA